MTQLVDQNLPPIKGIDERQYKRSACFALQPADFANYANLIATSMEPDSIVTGGFVNVVTAFNTSGTGSTDVLNIGDSDGATRYANAIDLKTTGYHAFSASNGFMYTSPGDLAMLFARTVAGTGVVTATTGEIIVSFDIVRLGRSDYTQG